MLAAAALHAAGALVPPAGAGTWNDPWSALTGWRLWGAARQRAQFRIDGDEVDAVVTFTEARGARIDAASTSLAVRAFRRDGGYVVLDLEDRIAPVRIVPAGTGLHVLHDGRTCTVALPDHAVDDGETSSGLVHVTAPLPGRVAKVSVRGGDAVERGATLVVLEAMKMELGVEAPCGGRIDEVAVSEGDQVVEGAVLVTFADEDGPDGRREGENEGESVQAATPPPP